MLAERVLMFTTASGSESAPESKPCRPLPSIAKAMLAAAALPALSWYSMKPTSLRVFSLVSLAMVVAFPFYLPRTDLRPLQAELQAQEQRLVAMQAAGKQHQYELKVQQEVMHASQGYLSQISQGSFGRVCRIE